VGIKVALLNVLLEIQLKILLVISNYQCGQLMQGGQKSHLGRHSPPLNLPMMSCMHTYLHIHCYMHNKFANHIN